METEREGTWLNLGARGDIHGCRSLNHVLRDARALRQMMRAPSIVKGVAGRGDHSGKAQQKTTDVCRELQAHDIPEA